MEFKEAMEYIDVIRERHDLPLLETLMMMDSRIWEYDDTERAAYYVVTSGFRKLLCE
jgi:hypothetical protein